MLFMWLSSPALYSAYKTRLNNALKADYGDFPDYDHDGNLWANIGIVRVACYVHCALSIESR